MIAPVSLAVNTRLRTRGKLDAQPRELMLQNGIGGGGQVVADQAEVQVPALRAAVGSLDPGRNNVRVAR